MPFLFRSERLAALENAHFRLRGLPIDMNIKGSIDNFLDKITHRDDKVEANTSMHAFYRKLEVQLYDTSVSTELNKELDRIEGYLLDAADEAENDPLILKRAQRAQITGSIFSPFWIAAQDFLLGLNTMRNLTRQTYQVPVSHILLSLPLVHDIYGVDDDGHGKFKDNIFSNLLLSVLNPVKLISSLIGVGQLGAYRLFEVGLEQRKDESDRTPIPQAFLKGLVSLAAIIIFIPLTILRPFSDILPAIVNNLLIQPVKYIHGRLSTPTRNEPDLEPSVEGREATKGPDAPPLVEDSSRQQHRARVRAQDLPGKQRDLTNDNKFYPIGGADQGDSSVEEEKDDKLPGKKF
jgi:hypothetical protein